MKIRCLSRYSPNKIFVKLFLPKVFVSTSFRLNISGVRVRGGSFYLFFMIQIYGEA